MMSSDDLLNGGYAGPMTAPQNQAIVQPSQLASPIASGGVKMASKAASSTVFLAWLIMFALLVMAHILTLSLQR